ncbi:ABC transporter permease [Cellulomonas sp. zg-ZUI222]|uniref:ABC transporter permease n=1 Tax=Cellulomonas wangleii TaxID=2816956 RepID=A0ABX8D3H0_9CELL|nr:MULTISPECIES: methionine ABC transporter permease [Cellulomonas]MBO0899070.1 ABC transporter permease [Cellulomonas sp. zg-ZUI22]MBO0919923.1 ABC transporter permease [Cellulomonas wangleii]MBO0923648.1 ABC transporter permease [Cellulomonas wangleii]QVI61969.1 ABC transporter permease [Cellulomonas wangleii]
MGDLWTELTTNRVITEKLPEATLETLQMVGLSALITVVVGLPLGLLLRSLAPDGLLPHRPLSVVLGFVVNVLRSLPFIILAVAVIPVTRAIVGTSLGWEAAVVPLSIGTIPFFARLVETAVRDVAPGKVEAARVMGSTTPKILRSVLVREALPAIVSGFTVTVIALIGFSAMVGAIGGGGLGFLAITYGFQRFDPVVLYTSVVVIIVLVTVVQVVGDAVARRLDHR